MPPAHGRLSNLVSLIANATKTVESHFQKTSKPYVPSLDDTEPHPLDKSSISLDLRLAIQTIEGACGQLVATVARPSRTMASKVWGVSEMACLNIVAKHNIAGILAEAPDKEGLHISEIAKRTGTDTNKIGRIMRTLATRHIFREVSEGVYVNNRLSMQFLNVKGLCELTEFTTQDVISLVPHLNEALVDKEWRHSFSPNHTAFNKATGYPNTVFDYFNGKDTQVGALAGKLFAPTMVATSTICEAEAIVTEYPWKDLAEGSTVVDIGSGVGPISIQLAKHHPGLQIVLQDQLDTLITARDTVWPKECPEAITENRVNFHPINFFEESPIPGADIYLLKNVIHDWEDNLVVKILTNVRNAMAPRSRVLIYEPIIQDMAASPDHESSFHKKAPSPLLSNYGTGRTIPNNMDIMMMLFLNGMERRVQDHIKLANMAGLKFVKFWDFGESGMVELMLEDVRQNS